MVQAREKPMVDVPQEQRERLEQLVRQTSCDRRHACFQSGLEQLRRVDWAAGEQVLFCQDENGWHCRNGMRFGQSTICQCSVRHYIAKHFHR